VTVIATYADVLIGFPIRLVGACPPPTPDWTPLASWPSHLIGCRGIRYAECHSLLSLLSPPPARPGWSVHGRRRGRGCRPRVSRWAWRCTVKWGAGMGVGMACKHRAPSTGASYTLTLCVRSEPSYLLPQHTAQQGALPRAPWPSASPPPLRRHRLASIGG
jgi:hypothetical protein